MTLTEAERKNIHDWLIFHTGYEKEKETGKYFWEDFPDNRLNAVYRKFLEEGYALNEYVVHRKKGDILKKSYCRLILDYQKEQGFEKYTYNDLCNIKIERLREMCIELKLIPDTRRKVTSSTPAEKDLISVAKSNLSSNLERQTAISSALYDEHEEFLHLDELVDMYGINITDENISTIEETGVKVLDSYNGSKPYNERREKLKETLINFIVMNRIKDHRGNILSRKQLERLDLNSLQIIYENLRSKLSSKDLERYPSSEELENKVRFGK